LRETRLSLHSAKKARPPFADLCRLAGASRRRPHPSLASARHSPLYPGLRAHSKRPHLVIGKSTRSRWCSRSCTSRVPRPCAAGRHIGVHVVPARKTGATIQRHQGCQPARMPPYPRPIPYATALLAIALAVGGRKACKQPLLGHRSVDLLLLHAIVRLACGSDAAPRCWLPGASLSYNFFFMMPPVYTFTMHRSHTHTVRVRADSLSASVVVSNCRARGPTPSRAPDACSTTIESLLLLSRQARLASTVCTCCGPTYHTASRADAEVCVSSFWAARRTLRLRRPVTPRGQAQEADLAAARWACEKVRVAGRDSDTLPGAMWLFTRAPRHRHQSSSCGHRPRRSGALCWAQTRGA